MAATRREFLLALATSTFGAVAFTGCRPSVQETQMESRPRMAEDVISAYENWYATACRQCSGGCGTIVRVVDGRAKKAEGNPDHPVNVGKLCARGQASVQEQYHPDRLTGPLLRSGDRVSGSLDPTAWSLALDRVATRLRDAQATGRGQMVSVVTGPLRGHRALLVDRFTRALGAEWLALDPLGETPLREAVRRVFGQDRLPTFSIRDARYILSFSADFLHTWLAPVHYGVEYGIFRQGTYDVDGFRPGTSRGHLVQVEPRFSGTAASADEWVYVRPGQEGVLALSLAQVILSEGLADPAAARQYGDAAALEAYTPERVSASLGIDADRIRRIARDFAGRRPSLAIGGGLAGAHTNGTDALTAILRLNLLVGSVGQGITFPGAPPLPDLPAPRRPAALTDWQGFVERLRSGAVETVLVAGANPVHALPESLGLPDALRQAPFIGSFSSFLDETTALADTVLPAHLSLEDWGDDVPDPAPAARTFTLQQPVVRPLYDTRGFGDILLALGEEIGGAVQQALPWPTYRDLLRDAARSLQQQTGGSASDADFERFWTTLLQHGGWWESTPSASQPSPPVASPTALPAATLAGSAPDYPFFLVPFEHPALGTGEGAHLPWLQATSDPITSATWQTWVEVNPTQARQIGLQEGDVVRVASEQGQVEVPVYVSPAAPPDVLAMPLGQGHTLYGRWAEGRGVNPLDLVAPLADQATGALAYAATRARLEKTGRHVPLPKFEGTEPAYQLPGREVLKVTGGG